MRFKVPSKGFKFLRLNKAAAAFGISTLLCLTTALHAGKVIEDFEQGFDPGKSLLNETAGQLVDAGGNQLLRLTSEGMAEERGIRLLPPGGSWDLSAYATLQVEVTNHHVDPLKLHLSMGGPNPEGQTRHMSGMGIVPPGETQLVAIPLAPTPFRLEEPIEFFGMRYDPGELTVMLDQVKSIKLFVSVNADSFDFSIDQLMATGKPQVLSSEDFFPFIDRFGQMIHGDWPGKLKDAADLTMRAHAEKEWLSTVTRPVRSRFGGWKNEDYRREGTGHFRAEKIDGRWWMVDPDGYLFWSHGVNGVNSAAYTPITLREHYFEGLPEEDSPLAALYETSDWAPQGDYKGKVPYTSYNHLRANLYRKYGPDWEKQFAKKAHARLRAWGMNTIGNWSDYDLCDMSVTPYTLPIHFEERSRRIEGSQGYWMKFPDVFDKNYVSLAEDEMRKYSWAVDDPYFIGFFVDNELGWGEETYLAEATLSSPADQPAKLEFVDRLKKKYDSIKELNKIWGTNHASWKALLESRKAPDLKKAHDDLSEFSEYVAHAYFRINRDIVHSVAPGKLYLGCRFAEKNPRAIRAASLYCDILTINKYDYELRPVEVPEDVDRPVIIGEFHFGAPDRGVFGPGLKAAVSQSERGALYRGYVREALDHPLVVGTHWFIYADQSTTARGDGENFQIGLIDVTDTPYGELIDAVQDVGSTMYSVRAGLME